MTEHVKIKSIEIENYRSCLKTKFELQDDISVLIGANGSGKTNVLSALLLLNALTRPTQIRFSEFDSRTTIRVEYYQKNRRVIHTSELLIDNSEGNRDKVSVADQKWYLRDFSGSRKRPNFPIDLFGPYRSRHRSLSNHFNLFALSSMPRGYRDFVSSAIGAENQDYAASSIQILNKIYKLLSGMKYYSATQFTNPKSCPVSFEIEKEQDVYRGLRIRGHAKFLYDLYIARETKGFTEFLNVIGKDGLGLIDDIKFNYAETGSVEYQVRTGGEIKEKKQEKMLIVPQFEVGSSVLSPNQLSDGTFKTITLLFYVMTQTSSILMIEEPEVCVHHGLLSSIIDVIKAYSDDKQIIISTHSDFILDKIPPNKVYFVQNLENGTEVSNLEKSLNKDDRNSLKFYLENEGNLGDYWRHGGFSE